MPLILNIPKSVGFYCDELKNLTLTGTIESPSTGMVIKSESVAKRCNEKTRIGDKEGKSAYCQGQTAGFRYCK
jgi:hypothetical protein